MDIDTGVAARLRGTEWKFGLDPEALAEIRHRIAEVARHKRTIDGSRFRPRVSEEARHSGGEFERAFIGEYLGRMCVETYCDHGFFASAIVVGRDTGQPRSFFFRWMREVGALGGDADREMGSWIEHVNATQSRYREHRE